jgi:hypothetical protein
MSYDEKKLKLIYVLKIGYNTKDEGLYEFIFSLDHTNIDVEGWCWDLSPACDNALPPTKDYYNTIINLKTSSFDLFCLHEAVDREYMHGYHTIHALAFETERNSGNNGFNDYDKMFGDEDKPLLVFHYGMSLEKIREMLNDRNIILKNNEFIEASSVEF